MRKEVQRDCHLPKVTIREQIPGMLESKAHVHSGLTVSQGAVPSHSRLPPLGGVTHPEGADIEDRVASLGQIICLGSRKPEGSQQGGKELSAADLPGPAVQGIQLRESRSALSHIPG